MMGYLKYFKTQITVGLQYKTAAFAGLMTQFFWGFISAFVYFAFYSHASVDNFNLNELMSYLWLNQAFFSLIYLNVKDAEMLSSITNGTVAYELLRPYNLYNWWFIKLLSIRYAKVVLRCIPIILVALILPKPFNLSLLYNFSSLILSIITLILGTFVITSINMLVSSLTFFTLQDKGLTSIFYNIGSLLGGFMLPVPLLPNYIIRVGNFLPFRFIGDLPFRIYSGNIGISNAINDIIIQIIWIIILVFIGRIIMKRALKKVCIQGG